MKKSLLGMAVGALALGASVVPASAAPDSIWKQLDGSVIGQLVLISSGNMTSMLNNCAQTAPKYTMFAPNDIVFEGYDDLDIAGLFEILGVSVASLSKTPSVVQGILNDHIVNGVFSPDVLDANQSTSGNDQSIKKITARSGYVLSIVNDSGWVPAGFITGRGPEYGGIYVDGNYVDLDAGSEACNGWIYWFDGFIDSSANGLHEGTNVQDAPTDGTPGGTNSLPDTL